MKTNIVKELGLVTALLLACILIAVPVLAQTSYATVSVTESSGNSYSMIGLTYSANITSWVSSGYTVNGTDIQIAMPSNVPRMVASDRITFASAVTASGTTTGTLTLGNTPADFAIVPGYNGYISTASDTDLDIGPSGNYTWNGWFNPTSTGYLLNKVEAITVQGNGSGSIIVTVNGTSSTNSTAFRPNAAGDMTNLTPSAGFNWSCSGDANDATYVSKVSTPYVGDLYNITNHTTETGVINSVTVYFRVKVVAEAACHAKPQWKIASVSYLGTEVDYSVTSYTTYNQVYATSPATGLAWTWSELDGAQYGILLNNSGTGWTVSAADIWYIVNYVPGYSTTSAVISAAEHTIGVYLTGGNLGIVVDGITSGTPVAYAGSVPTNANPMIWCNGNIMPYCNYIKVYKAGGQNLLYQPNTRIMGTTLPDRVDSGGYENGTITWGGNPTGVSVAVGSLTPYPTSPAATTTSSSNILPEGNAGNPFIANPAPTLPGIDIPKNFSTSLGIPLQATIGFFGFLFMLVVWDIVFDFTKEHSDKGEGSVFLSFIASGLVMVGLVYVGFNTTTGAGLLPLWPVLPWIILNVTGMIAERVGYV